MTNEEGGRVSERERRVHVDRVSEDLLHGEIVPEAEAPAVAAADIAREASAIVDDAADGERPVLHAHRLPALGAEIVHWRPHGEREFRYILRECFD